MRILDTNQFCTEAGISKTTLTKWMKLGLLPTRKLGLQALYFKESDLAAVETIKAKMTERMNSGYKFQKTTKKERTG